MLGCRLAHFVFGRYTQILNTPPSEAFLVGRTIPIPRFVPTILAELCRLAKIHFFNQPMVLNIQSPLIVVGDLHGNFHDLLRIILTNGLPSQYTKYLFLGDYVDRGEFSTEVMTFLFCIALIFPQSVFLIRGNHECDDINETYGFKEEIIETYGNDQLWHSFNEVFNQMPIAALVDEKIFAVHGGISDKLKSIEELNNVKRPLTGEMIKQIPLIVDLLWSDPIFSNFGFMESERGLGNLFGFQSIHDFLNRCEVSSVIRAHQCVSDGYQNLLHGKCVTVFSSSNYCGEMNEGAYLKLSPTQKKETKKLTPKEILSRSKAIIREISIPNAMIYTSLSKVMILRPKAIVLSTKARSGILMRMKSTPSPPRHFPK